MSDPGHMDRRYLWRANKASRRVHILNPGTDRAFCQTENGGGRPLDGRGAEVPVGRRVCGNCIDLAGQDEAGYQEPDVRVLMGERLPEVEPELFSSTVAPEPKQTDLTSDRVPKFTRARRSARRANRSKGRKPRRSTAKYTKPFDDDLPW